MQAEVDPTMLMNDFLAGAEHLPGHDLSTGRVGAVGFCYGGGVCSALAVASPELGASGPFHGRQAPVGDAATAKVEVPLLFQFAEIDENVNATWPAYEAALKAAGKTYEAHVYPGTNHGFDNDSTPRYDAEDLAWQRTLDWFGRYLA